MPLFHVHGLMASTLATSRGGTVGAPQVQSVVVRRVARESGVTWYSAVPTIHQLLLARAADPTAATGWQREACASSGRAARRCRRE